MYSAATGWMVSSTTIFTTSARATKDAAQKASAIAIFKNRPGRIGITSRLRRSGLAGRSGRNVMLQGRGYGVRRIERQGAVNVLLRAHRVIVRQIQARQH